MTHSAPRKTRFAEIKRFRFYRPRWTVVLAIALMLACLVSLLSDVFQVHNVAQKIALVDSGVSNSLAGLEESYVQQATVIQSVMDLAADGLQPLSPAWRSAAIAYQRSTQKLDAALADAQERVRIAEQHGLDSIHIESQLYQLEQLRGSLQDDISTLIRLTDEGRSSDIASMHENISASSAAVKEQLDTLHQYSQLALLSSTKKIQQSSYRILYACFGTILLSTYVCVQFWSNRPRNPSRSKKKSEEAREPEEYLEIATEQALNERFLLRGVHVLVAEDDIGSRRLLAKVFEHAGAVVTVACDGVQALNRFRKSADSGHPVQLIILDLMMPDCDGIQVASQLREVDQFTGPILALTAVPDSNMRTSCLEAGFDDYLAKPIDRKKLLKLATDYLGKSSIPVSDFVE